MNKFKIKTPYDEEVELTSSTPLFNLEEFLTNYTRLQNPGNYNINTRRIFSSWQKFVRTHGFLGIETIDLPVFGDFVNISLQVVAEVYGSDAPYMSELDALMRKAMKHEDNMLQDYEIIENGLGEGWVAEEALAIAVFSVLRHFDNFTDVL